jgi:hypothetical protein
MFVDTDRQVLNRLVQNQEFGLFSAGGSLDREGAYVSQIGLGGWLLTVLPTLVGARGWIGEFLIFSQIAMLNAGVFTFVADRIKTVFGTAASFVLVIMLIQPMSIAINGSPRFMIGVRLLPALILAMQLFKPKVVSMGAIGAMFAASFVGYASGYDYASITPATVAGVLAASAVIHRWRFGILLRQAALPLAATIVALVGTIGAHLVQLSLRFGGFQEALSVVNYRLAKRSGLVDDLVSDPLLVESLASSPLRVLDWYLAFPIFLGPARVPILHLVSVGILIVAVLLLSFTFAYESDGSIGNRVKFGLAVGWVVSLLGPLGWYLLARPSAYIHTHTDGAAWFFPTIPIGAVLVIVAISKPFHRQSWSLRAYLIALSFTVAVIGMLIWISQTQAQGM